MLRTGLATTELGGTGLEITRVGFGAWAIGGGGWEFGWGDQDDEESISAIRRALGLGVNWIDTAAAYGFGRSEHIVGRALEGLDERPYVFTKASCLNDGTGRVAHVLNATRSGVTSTVASSASASMRSTSTRSTGRFRMATSGRGGQHSRS
jgi:aryl-alcohol dehydrogenase-like predicted oxidoreductase